MAFRFSLQSLLSFRQSVEHQEELRLRAANQQLAGARHIIEQLDSRIRQVREILSKELAVGTTSAELRFALAIEASLCHQHLELELELSRRERLRDQQQRTFQQARRERETFEILRDQKMNQYRCEVRRREQREFDDLYLSRRSCVPRG